MNPSSNIGGVIVVESEMSGETACDWACVSIGSDSIREAACTGELVFFVVGR